MKDENFNLKMWKHTREIYLKKPHAAGRGWSAIGYCKGKQCIDHWYNIAFDPKNAIPGSNLHEFNQYEIFPIGSFVMDRYYIVAHEVPVFIEINGEMRWSPIDTLAFDSHDRVLEIWDYKGTAWSSYKKDDSSIENLMQVNLYGYLYSIAKRIRLIYQDFKDYSQIYSHVYPIDADLAKATIERMILVDNAKTDKEKYPFHQLVIDEITKPNIKDANCKWCPYTQNYNDPEGKTHPPYCLLHLRKALGQEFKLWSEAREYLIKQSGESKK